MTQLLEGTEPMSGVNEGRVRLWTDLPLLACHLCGYLTDHNTAAHGVDRSDPLGPGGGR